MDIVQVCIFVFFARIMDVSIGTVRTITLVKGKAITTAILAFIEVFIWYCAASRALSTEEFSIFIAIFYALGYATGTLVGSVLSKIFIKGNTTLQAITKNATPENIELIRKKGYGVSVLNIENNYDEYERKLLILEVDNKEIKKLTKLIKEIDKDVFITYNETKSVLNGFIK